MGAALALPGFEEVVDDLVVDGVVVRLGPTRGDFRVLDVEVERDGRGIIETWIGEVPPVAVGQRVRGSGTWETHRDYGKRFRLTMLAGLLPTTRKAIVEYLGAGIIPGIGPTLAERIVEHFGEGVLDVLDLSPDRISEVPGIGPDRAEKVAKGWRLAQATARMTIFLQSHGATPGLAQKIVKHYLDRNEDPMTVVTSTPYRLALEVYSVGFQTADIIARSIGIGTDSDTRAQAAALHLLDDIGKNGHVYVDLDELTVKVATLTTRPGGEARASIRRAIEELGATGGKIVIDPYEGEPEQTLFGQEVTRRAAVFPAEVYAAEWDVARRLVTLAGSLGRGRVDAVETMREHAEAAIAAAAITLAEEQRAAVFAAAEHAVIVVTGGPGTGKTTVLQVILDLYKRAGMRVACCAPTARAANRMLEATGTASKTIHRLLEIQRGNRPFFTEERPLDTDVLVVDESSMVDLRLAAFLLGAVPNGARVVIIGDRNQLPSVQPGAVLHDIIASGAVPVIELNRIYRQGPGSTISKAAAAINRGEIPSGDAGGQGEFFRVTRGNQDEAAATIEHLVTTRIPSVFGIPASQIAVLVPQHKGAGGTFALNDRLQEALNPHGAELARGGRRFRVGDPVVQRRNDYMREVFNGDRGVVAVVEPSIAEVVVDFDGRRVRYDDEEMAQLVLGYATTIHSSQGGEFPAVVVYAGSESEHMLACSMLYTAITRGKKLVVVVATHAVIASAIRRKDRRRTRLAARIKSLSA